MTRYVSWTLSVLLALLLAACGFQLRGMNPATMRPYPFTSVYVDSSVPLAKEISRLLKLDPNVTLLDKAKGADSVLRIISVDQTTDILTIDRSGQANEYRLTYIAKARLYFHGAPLGDDIVIKQFRSMTYSDSDILGKGSEEQLLWTDMMQDSAQQILFRLSSSQMINDAASAAAATVAPAAKVPNAGSQP
jgi:LPS-assembly lipoprotein